MRAPTPFTTFGHSVLAATIATLVLSGFMGLLAIAMDAPDLHIARMLQVMLLGPSVLAWGVYLTIGIVVLGPLYILFDQVLPGAPHVRGVLFALLPYTLLSLVVMPLGGVMFFAINHGPAGILGMLLVHLAYGATLGTLYHALQTQSVSPYAGKTTTRARAAQIPIRRRRLASV